MKIFLDTVGCRLNQAEIETLARLFRLAGHEIIATPDLADLAVVNTCTVTAEAAADSRSALRRARRLGAAEVIATGCWVTMEPDAAANLINGIRIVPNPKKDDLVTDLLHLPIKSSNLEPIARQPLPGLHRRTRAFIKVQDGCDNTCTYCITRRARGPSRSRSVDEIIADIDSAQNGGTLEVVLTGVHLGAWGLDISPKNKLQDLVYTLLKQTSVPRIRLSSLEPWDLDSEFFELWQDQRLCRHLHLPLQSGSEAVLRRMARRTVPGVFRSLVQSAKEKIPNVAITTDLMVGFPGETDKEFLETLDFVKSIGFSWGHVFTFSPRPCTPAARMGGTVAHTIAKARSTELRNLLSQSAEAFRQGFMGKILPVLWETTSRLSDQCWQMEGLTDNYLRVSANSKEPHWNTIDQVLLKESKPTGLRGEIVSQIDSLS